MEVAIIAALLPIIGGAIGKALAAGDRAEADRLRQQAMDQYNIDLPNVDDIAAVHQQQSSIKDYQEDPRLRDAQLSALERMQDTVNSNGMDAEFAHQMGQARADVSGQAYASQQAAESDALSRGISGSNIELMNRMMGGQDATDRFADMASGAAAEAQRRRDAAVAALGRMGGEMRGQDWDMAAGKADRLDAINRFNTELTNSTNQFNVGSRFQKWDADFRTRQGKAGAYGAMASAKDGNADDTEQSITQMGVGASQALTGAATGGTGKKKPE
jgi:hypothetical protein